MNIYQDDKFAQDVKGVLIKKYLADDKKHRKERDRQSKWHVSDLIFPRATYNRMVHGEEEVTEKSIGFWFLGKALHKELQEALGERYSEVEKYLGDIVGNLDYFDGGTLLEIKTSRKWTIPDLPDPHYIRQAGYYAAMTRTRVVRIVVVYPVAGRTMKAWIQSTIEFRVWVLEFSDKELDTIAYVMHALKAAILEAVKHKDPRFLPACPAFKCEMNRGVYRRKIEELHPFFTEDITVEERTQEEERPVRGRGNLRAKGKGSTGKDWVQGSSLGRLKRSI